MYEQNIFDHEYCWKQQPTVSRSLLTVFSVMKCLMKSCHQRYSREKCVGKIVRTKRVLEKNEKYYRKPRAINVTEEDERN